MSIEFGREICGELSSAESREWLVTNGIGGYASGTIAGLNTRRYHGLLIAALNPPLGRTLLLAKLDETALYNEQRYPLHANRWATGAVEPQGYRHIERFTLEGTVPVWRLACADALLEKRVWMQQGANTTYVQYTLLRATQPLTLSLKALVNYRDHHGDTQANGWQMGVEPLAQGIRIKAFPEAAPFYLLGNTANTSPAHDWYKNFDLAIERYRGLSDREDHLHAATFELTLKPGESLTFVASTEPSPNLYGVEALNARHTHEQTLLSLRNTTLLPIDLS
jgi:predicted glycogen debranching enzyme